MGEQHVIESGRWPRRSSRTSALDRRLPRVDTATEHTGQPDLSVVTPAYNEAPNLEPLIVGIDAALDGLALRYEILLVDDGSTDDTAERARRLSRRRPHLRYLRFTENRGQSAALAAGLRAARGHWLLTLDADLQNPPEEIPRLLAAGGDVDLCFGRRRRRQDPRLKRWASRWGNAVRNRITGHRVHDTGCGLKLMRAEALAAIPLFDGAHRFLPSLFQAHGFSTCEIEVAHAPRIAGRSKYGIRNRAVRGLVDCFGTRWLIRRSLAAARPAEEPIVGDSAAARQPERHQRSATATGLDA